MAASKKTTNKDEPITFICSEIIDESKDIAPEEAQVSNVETKINEKPFDPLEYPCPENDSYLRSIWPKDNIALLENAKRMRENAKTGTVSNVISSRTPLKDYDQDVKGYFCPGCKTQLIKGTYFWPNNGIQGHIHVDKQPRTILCKQCIRELYNKILAQYGSDVRKSMMRLCINLDFYYDSELIDHLITFGYQTGFPDLYLRIITDKGTQNNWKGKDFFNQIPSDTWEQLCNGGYDYHSHSDEYAQIRQEQMEAGLSSEDKVYRSKILATYLYDPFVEYDIDARKKMYRELYLMLDDTIAEDLPRQRAALEIVVAYRQLASFNDRLQSLIASGLTDKETADNIAKWTAMCSAKASIIEKQARENGFSMRYAGNNAKGSGTLSGITKELNENCFDDIITNYYDIKTSSSIRHIADISSKSILAQLELNENDYCDMIKYQAEVIRKQQADLDGLTEQVRLIKKQITKQRLLNELELEYKEKGLPQTEIQFILEDEYKTPDVLNLRQELKNRQSPPVIINTKPETPEIDQNEAQSAKISDDCEDKNEDTEDFEDE